MATGSISSANKNRSLAQWFLPSIADLIFIAFLGVLSFTNLSVRLLGDAGIGWHIRTGQWILSTRSIPHTDPFSSSMVGHPWFAWEWLYDVFVGGLDHAAGLNGVVLLTALIIAVTFSWMFRLLVQRKTSLFVALILVLLAASASMIHFFARPHVVTWLFCVLWLSTLDRFDSQKAGELNARQNRHLLYLLPLSMLIWVNVHGGFLLGFALLAIYWLSAVWEYFRGNENDFGDVLAKLRAGKRARDLSRTAFVSAAATFVNPYGWKLHLHIYRYLSNRFLMDHIDEFQSPNFHGIAQKCFALLLLLALLHLATHAIEGYKIRLSELLLVLFAAYSGLYAARNIPVSSLLLIWVIGPRLSRALKSLTERVSRRAPAETRSSESFLPRMQVIDARLRGHLWPIAALVISAWIAFHGGKISGDTVMNAHFDAQRFPAAAVDYLIEHHIFGPIFAPDSWGGYLIYRLYPQAKVVVDDRHDFYGEAFLKSYLRTIHVEPEWEDFLLQYPANALIVPRSSALANILLETRRWHTVYSDEVAIVFEGNPSP